MALDWKLTVWPATGGVPREIVRDASFVSGTGGRGLRLQVTPEGECREAVFSAKGSGIQLPPLSAVQVSYLHLGIWTPIFFGEVRRGGNARDVLGEDYALRGMSRRLEEVTLSPGFSAPEQSAHLTVRAIIQDVLASGQLGSPALVQYVESLCPDLGFDCREVKDAMQQNPAALLRQIAEDGAKYGVLVRWGVDPQRRFFCRPAKSDVRDVSTEAPVITWTPPVAETPCTAVLWYVAKKPDGTWVTHLSRSAQADVFGDRVKGQSVDASIYPWVTLPYTVGTKGVVDQPPISLTVTEREYLTDGLIVPATERNFPVFTPDTAGATDHLYVQATAGTGAQRVVIWGSSNYGRDVVLTADGVQIGEFPGTGSNLNEFKATLYAGGTVFRAEAGAADVSLPEGAVSQFQMFEMRPERVDVDLLDGLAAFHYVSPAMEPADIQTVLFVPPVELPGRVRVTPAVGSVYEHPLEAVEYRITSNGMQMGWLAGQADDPNALAQASLIKRRDGEAVITSITAQT